MTSNWTCPTCGSKNHYLVTDIPVTLNVPYSIIVRCAHCGARDDINVFMSRDSLTAARPDET